MTAMFRIVEPGAYTTVQDQGRFGWQQFGVPPAGMLDRFAGKVANMLTGNPGNAAVLEFTFSGPTLEILAPATIAVTGADMPLWLNNRPVDRWRSFQVNPGDILKTGMARSGCRAYLAVSGGIDVPEVMGSRACYIGAGIGGFGGRILKTGDVLKRGSGDIASRTRQVLPEHIPDYPAEITLRAIPGPQDDYFDEGLKTFFSKAFTVSPQANRMGYRLQGPPVLPKPGMPKSIVSEPGLPGGVQIPQDGQPIILLTEQTVGGYSKIATVISCDIFRVAQAMPGDRIRFEAVDIETAHRLYREHESLMAEIREYLEIQATGSDFFHSEIFADRAAAHLCQI